MVASDELVTIGRLGKTRGVNGEMYVTPTSEYPERFEGLKEIFVSNRGAWEKRLIASVRIVSGRPVLKFDGIDSPEDAARMVNRDLALPRNELIELPDNTYFVFDLIGCTVYDDKTGARVGEVVDVEQYPANDVYIIDGGDGRRLECPAAEEFVKRVDVEKRAIRIVMDGLSETE